MKQIRTGPAYDVDNYLKSDAFRKEVTKSSGAARPPAPAAARGGIRINIVIGDEDIQRLPARTKQ
jgi:hypothetical protein